MSEKKATASSLFTELTAMDSVWTKTFMPLARRRLPHSRGAAATGIF